MLNCPKCTAQTQVIDSRSHQAGQSIRRRRRCTVCGFRLTTLEQAKQAMIWVSKEDGTIEAFDRSKLTRSISIALHKRPPDENAIQQLVEDICIKIAALKKQRLPSHTIGALALSGLRELDAVGYIRFASVYQDFQSETDFAAFLQSQD